MKAMSAETGTAMTELNLEQIKAAAMAVGGAESGTWQALRYTVMLPDGDCILNAYDSMGAMPEPIHGDDVAAFIAAANPAAVLALIARLEQAEQERDNYKRALLSGSARWPAGGRGGGVAAD